MNDGARTKLFHGQREIGSVDADGRLIKNGNRVDIAPNVENVLPFVLKNSLPEGERYENLVLNSRRGIRSPIDALMALDELQGNFSINMPDRRAYLPFPKTEYDVVYATNNLSADMFFVNSPARAVQKPSFSGYQDKFTAKAYLHEDKLCVGPADASKEFGNIIVKPGNKLPFVAENELACMRLAGRCGLDVPRTFLLRHPDPRLDIRHFCIERFDFRRAPQPGKRDVMEFASIMGLDSQSKYLARTEDLFQTAEKYLDDVDIKKLAKAYLFGIMTGNGDMHTKNFSVFIEKDKYLLTPIYDMVNTAVHGFPDILALPMNENSSRNPSMNSIVVFFEKYVDRKEIYHLARDIRQNLTRVLDLAFTHEEEKTEFMDRSRMKFRRNFEKSILNRVESMLQCDLWERMTPSQSYGAPPA
jgi:serine/threonine-protein kinase HipA